MFTIEQQRHIGTAARAVINSKITATRAYDRVAPYFKQDQPKTVIAAIFRKACKVRESSKRKGK